MLEKYLKKIKDKLHRHKWQYLDKEVYSCVTYFLNRECFCGVQEHLVLEIDQEGGIWYTHYVKGKYINGEK
jgi:hypothetical protein